MSSSQRRFASLMIVALAVSSGRADAMVTAVFGALVAKNRNPDLGDFVLPSPTVYLPSYAGMRREQDDSFRKFCSTGRSGTSCSATPTCASGNT